MSLLRWPIMVDEMPCFHLIEVRSWGNDFPGRNIDKSGITSVLRLRHGFRHRAKVSYMCKAANYCIIQ